jgi:hypothetical protein
MKVKVNVKEIDLKSLLIGFLLAAVLFLTLGAGSGTQDVRIVGVSTYDNLRVHLEKISSSEQIPVKLEEIKYNMEIPVRLEEIKYNMEIPVKIENQPIDVRVK